MKQILLFILFPIILFGQTQIGSDINGEAVNDRSGSVSLSSDGTIVAIGGTGNDDNGVDSGHVRVYNWNGSTWTQLGSDIDGEAANDHSGNSISLSSDGTIVAIGGHFNDGNGNSSGHVRIYNWNGSTWTQIGSDIDGEAANDFSANISLSSDGTTVAIGANNNDDNGIDSGHIRVYNWNGSAWTQLGSDIDGEAANDHSGNVSLSSDGTTVAIGGNGNDDNGDNSGHVRIYNWNGSTWTQIGSDINGKFASDYLGSTVSISSNGTIVAIGAFNNTVNDPDNLEDIGLVRVYNNLGGIWTQIGNDINGENIGDLFGLISLSSNGSIVAISAIFNDDNGNNSGKVKVYKNVEGIWTQIGNDIIGVAANDYLGGGVSLSSDGTIIAIGATGNDSNGVDSGHVRVYDLSAVLSNDSFVLSQFNLYPNPVKEQFTIQLQEGLELQSVNIYNSLGQFIKATNNNIINTSELSTGIYYVEIITNKGKATKKLVIN